ncbi:MAG: tRNA glutamyl-Q(34) synthetase GluQRS [Hyphomicrobiales bacterium]|jgi:glutamyl-Q tRNA(Asp) synthetase|nr:tRNA glutamyl-Q(34) synthetase GluQRS [Hyphomicrobiales bacterium]
MSPPVLRFAPSPNGRLHLGHAYSALQNEAEARRLGGRLLLRIEDIDPTRCRPAYEAAILKDLRWLGVAFEPDVRRQSEHMDNYRAALLQLDAMGLLYPCNCSRSAIKAAAADPPLRNPDGALLYPGTCRLVAPGPDALATRLDMAKALEQCGRALSYQRFWSDGRVEEVTVRPGRWGDVVLARKETPTSYHLSVVVDDALQAVSHVVRGQDLEAQTDIHVLLQALLGLPTPLYQFHVLIRDDTDEKLAKSRGSTALADLRAAGETPAMIRTRLGFAQV